MSIRTKTILTLISLLADVLYADTAPAVQGLGSDEAGDKQDGLDYLDVHLDPLLCVQHSAVRVEPDRGGHFVRRERVPNVAREDSADVPVDDHVVVPVGVAQHDEVRALDKETGFPASLWRLQFGVVHLPAYLCPGREPRGTDVEVQVAAGHHELGGLPRLHRHDGAAVAE